MKWTDIKPFYNKKVRLELYNGMGEPYKVEFGKIIPYRDNSRGFYLQQGVNSKVAMHHGNVRNIREVK